MFMFAFIDWNSLMNKQPAHGGLPTGRLPVAVSANRLYYLCFWGLTQQTADFTLFITLGS